MTNNHAIFEALQAYYDYVASRNDVYVPWKYRKSHTDPKIDAAGALKIQLESEDYYADELLAFGTNYALAKYYEDTNLIELADTIVKISNPNETPSVSNEGFKLVPKWLFAMTRSLSYMGTDAIQKGIALCRLEYPEDNARPCNAAPSARLHLFNTLLARNVAAERYIQKPTQENRKRLEKILEISKKMDIENKYAFGLQQRRVDTEWLTLANTLVLKGITKESLQLPKINELVDYPDSALKNATNIYPLKDAPLPALDVLNMCIRIHGKEKVMLTSLLSCLKNDNNEGTLYYAMALHEAYPEDTNVEGSPVQSLFRYIFSTCTHPWKNMDAAMRNVFCSHSQINPWSQEYLKFKQTYGNKPIVNPAVKTALALGSIQEVVNMLDRSQVQPLAMPDIQEQP